MPGHHSSMGKALEFNPHKMRPRDSVAHADHGMYVVTPKHGVSYLSRGGSPKKLGTFGSRSEAIGAAQSHHDSVGKGGEAYLPRPKTEWATPREGMSRMNYGVRSKKDTTARRRAGIKPLGTHTVSAKGIQLVSLDDCYEAVVKAEKARGSADQDEGGEKPRLKKFPRSMSPATRMKPVSDEEAMARLRKDRGLHSKKSLRWLVTLKALATGYSKVSGGGALKAANRGPSMPLLGPNGRPGKGSRARKKYHPPKVRFGSDGRHGRRSNKAEFGPRRPGHGRLRRAMDAMPAPAGSAKPPKVYLPGVHNPKSPVRRPPGLKKPGSGVKRHPTSVKPPTLAASVRPSTVSERSPRALDGGGAVELSNSLGIIEPRSRVEKAEHGFERGDLVVHGRGIGAVGSRSTGTHVQFKKSAGSFEMIHHSEVRAATPADVKYHQNKVAKLYGLGFTKGITR